MEVEKKATEALESERKASREIKSLKDKIKLVEIEWEKKLETVKAEELKVFRSSNDFLVHKLEFTIESYLKCMVDYRFTVQSLFSNINLSKLDADKDEAVDVEEEVGSSDTKVALVEVAEATS
ncbi:hypothetical protein COCNU_10G010110 [Cocos nucifera]|uniref:Uncharacterized protein n=1 Tax=Cocos nucifera TaxID=13894 RepID=A0A8K0IN92_COCNU|nr:hypothetical protein COCNU_10G010110 [Cocos nucifera]